MFIANGVRARCGEEKRDPRICGSGVRADSALNVERNAFSAVGFVNTEAAKAACVYSSKRSALCGGCAKKGRA